MRDIGENGVEIEMLWDAERHVAPPRCLAESATLSRGWIVQGATSARREKGEKGKE